MAFRCESYCDIYCGSCPLLMASRRDGLDVIAERLGRDKKELFCEGYKGEKVSVFYSKCGIKQCALGHQVSFFKCDE